MESKDKATACQLCGKPGGKVVSFNYYGISFSRWICPHCIDSCYEAFEAMRENAQAIVDCFGLGLSPEKFVEQSRDFILDLRAALKLAEGTTQTQTAKAEPVK